jgi:hypothetical protein
VSNRGDLSNGLRRQLEKVLPKDWTSDFSTGSERQFDGRLEVVPPHGRPNRFDLEFKARFEPRDIDQLVRLSTQIAARHRILVVAPYLSARSRQLLKDRDISYADLTGNLWLSNDSLLIERIGADKAPKSGTDQARTSLRGHITGRVVRFLCDIRPPFKVREIAARTDVHPGNVSRILELLDRDRLIVRSAGGSVVDVDWESLIRRWSRDLEKDRRAEAFLEPRGVDVVISSLSKWTAKYAITGAYAGARIAPAAVPVAVDVYVTEIDEARARLSLRESERIGNVRLIRAFDRVAFERTVKRDGIILACPSQIAADLLTLPKRSIDEFSELITWMKRHESDWRL